MTKFIIGCIVICFVTVCGKRSDNNHDSDAGTSTFRNPLLPSGPDPWVAQKDGFYYYTNTLDNRIALWKTKAMSDLKNASVTTVWSPPPGTPYSRNIWAPEIHFLQDKWYIYFAADSAGVDSTHRLYVLENANADPTLGTWTFKGKVSAPGNYWALDPSEFEYNNSFYLIWSGWMNRRAASRTFTLPNFRTRGR